MGLGDVELVDLVVCLWCFDVWAGVVDAAAPEDFEDDDVDGAIVGFGAGAVDCAAATIGRPNAIARLTNFFISFLLLAMPSCIVIPEATYARFDERNMNGELGDSDGSDLQRPASRAEGRERGSRG